MNYSDFLKTFDEKIKYYSQLHKNFILCREGCSSCCKNGDYPMSQLEFEYLMQGYINLDDNDKQIVQKNIKSIKPHGNCPFLINDKCSVYKYRPIICRVHGLAYLNNNDKVIVPYCANKNKNYSSVYKNNFFEIEPIKENLDTPNVLKDFDYGEIRNLHDWFIF